VQSKKRRTNAVMPAFAVGLLASLALSLAVRAAPAEPASEAPSLSAEETQLLNAQQLARSNPEEALATLRHLTAAWPEGQRERVRAMEQMGQLLGAMRQLDAAERVAQDLESLAQRHPPLAERALAAAAYLRASLALKAGAKARAQRYMAEALQHLPADTPAWQRLTYVSYEANILERVGKVDDAVRVRLQAIALADAIGTPWRRSEQRSSLAYTLLQAGQTERAATMTQEAISIAREANDDLALGDAMLTKSMLAEEAKDEAGELDGLKAAVDAARRAHARRAEAHAIANMADFYLQHGQYRVAYEMSDQARRLAQELKERDSEALALSNMGMALIAQHHVDEGLHNVQQGLDMSEPFDTVGDRAATYEELGRFLERAGELRRAYEADQQYRKLADEMFRLEQQRAILEAQESYDNDRRNHSLELLNRQNRLKDEQLLQHELQQRLWAVGAALALLTFSVIALLVRRGRRVNRALADTNELLKVQSERDPLTGLANRRHFQEAMRRLAADGRLAGTVFLIDIDHFKHVNDVYGHAAGDRVLIEVARRLRGVLRDEDMIVRWGGEEFLVVVQSLSPEQIDALVSRLLSTLASEPVAAGAGAEVWISGSIGFATLPLEPGQVALSWERAIELVDTTLYLAKAHGRNRAYGIRLLHGRDEAEVMQIGRMLEQAWREGRVALKSVQGPALPVAAA
jgi:diguanylate cyclase (GGDEF)-like protein